MAEMDAQDQALLTAAQAAFPLCSRPFEALGQPLGLSEAEVIARLQALRLGGVLRQLSAIFDSRRLGYGSVLVAAHLTGPFLEGGAAQICRHPGVSHCYEREHYYDLWFTLATPPGQDVDAAAQALCREAGADAWHVLPALKTFKIGVKLDLTGSPPPPPPTPAGAGAGPSSPRLQRGEGNRQASRDQGKASIALPPAEGRGEEAPRPTGAEEGAERRAADLFPHDLDLIRALQEDLPLLARPFASLAARLGMQEEQVFDWMAEAGRRGFLRRFAAVIRHRQAGFSANGMGVWRVPEERIGELGRLFAASPAVSHCYQRPSFSDWPYNLFTMVHARSRPECNAVLDGLALSSGITERGVLYSTREFKKERVKYFLEGALAPLGADGARR